MRDFYTKVAGVEIGEYGARKEGREGQACPANKTKKKTISKPLRRCLSVAYYSFFFTSIFSALHLSNIKKNHENTYNNTDA